MVFAKTNKVLKKMTDFFAEQMRINLGAKVKRKSYRSKWRNGKPYNTSVKSFRASHSASGSLIRSIKVSKSNIGYAVSMNEYGVFVNDGREKGKGIPIPVMNKWIKKRDLKPRDLKTGEFKKNTPAARKSIGFMMNRKIKHFGIEPYPFIKTSRETTRYVFRDEIKKEMKKDIINNLGVIFKPKR